MSRPQAKPPGGLSWARFKALAAESGEWVWGTAKGAFNEKASISQILVDAVIGMIPLVGDATAVRDIIAVIMRMIDQPKKREEVWEWVLLIVLIVALIPVIGGVVKGAGRIVIKVAKHADTLTAAARAAHLASGAREIITFLNRIGTKNAEKWFLALKMSDHQAKLLERYNKLLDVMNDVLVQSRRRFGSMLPASVAQRIDGLRHGIATLKQLGGRMIPRAVREFDQRLREIQAFIHSGGQTTSRMAQHQIAKGPRTVTRAQEARLIENGAAPVRSRRGGWKKNAADATDPKSYAAVYHPAPGYPDLTAFKLDGKCPDICAFSGKIVNRQLKPGESTYRFFGPEGLTHQTKVGESYAGGAWWGVGAPPKNAKEWREKAAVLDEWNRDGFMVVGTVMPKRNVKAAVGTISEQSGKKIPGQYLPGGGMQAVVGLPKSTKDALYAASQEVVKTGKPVSFVDAASGMRFEVKPTGWKDANGIHGYLQQPGPGAVQTARLGAREMATKQNREVTH